MQDLKRFQVWKDNQEHMSKYNNLLRIESSSIYNQMQTLSDIDLYCNSEAEKILILRRLIRATKFISMQKRIINLTVMKIHQETNKVSIFQELAKYAIYKSVHRVILESSRSMKDSYKFLIIQSIIKSVVHKDIQHLLLKFICDMKYEYQTQLLKDLLPHISDQTLLNKIKLIQNNTTFYKRRSTKNLNKEHCIRLSEPPIEWLKFNQKNIVLNNIDDYKLEFKDCRNKVYNSFDKDKPICVYAVSNQYDHNGAILSNRTLILIKHEIQELSRFYNVVPIIFHDKDHLDNKIGKYCKKFNLNINLLFLVGHGSPNFFANININNTKLNNLTSNAQIVLASCSTAAGENINKSIAYKFAENNEGTIVFAADTGVEFVRPFFDLSNGPQIVSLGAICNKHELNSYKIFVNMKNCRSVSIL